MDLNDYVKFDNSRKQFEIVTGTRCIAFKAKYMEEV